MGEIYRMHSNGTDLRPWSILVASDLGDEDTLQKLESWSYTHILGVGIIEAKRESVGRQRSADPATASYPTSATH